MWDTHTVRRGEIQCNQRGTLSQFAGGGGGGDTVYSIRGTHILRGGGGDTLYSMRGTHIICGVGVIQCIR